MLSDYQTQTQESRVMPLDSEHLGIRLGVPLVAFLSCIGSYWAGLQLSAGGSGVPGGAVLIVGLSLAIAVGIAWGAERMFKRHWPSGRALHVDDHQLSLKERDGRATTLDWDMRINVLAWRFNVPPRRGRVPKGWLCMACQLLQDERFVTLYTFIPPEQAENFVYYHAFMQLRPRKELARESGGSLLAAGEQTRLHGAEFERWEGGAELDPTDFVDLVHMMDKRIDGWPGAGNVVVPRVSAASEAVERPPSKGDDEPIKL